ncbi:MAG: hypothetical protein ACK4M1_11730 [Flavobacterium sp.]
MKNNTILEFYRFSLINKTKEQQVLSFYNAEEDLLDTLNDFCNHIFENVKKYTDNQGKFRTFTLATLPIIKKEDRIIHGFLDSAYTGEYGKIKDRKTNGVKYNLDRNDLFSKEFFYLIYVPKGSKFGFLVIQKKENHGVKTIFETAFNNFMLYKGVSNYKIELRQAPPRYYLLNFLNEGEVKEVRLINENVERSEMTLQKEERILKLKKEDAFSKVIKEVLFQLYQTKIIDSQKISFLNYGDFDEISFVLTYNGICKTFYIKRKDKIRSNIDVSNLINFDNEIPNLFSLIEVSLEIINKAA